MKVLIIFCLMFAAITAAPSNESTLTSTNSPKPNLNLPLAEPCDPSKCLLPDCRCSQTYLSQDIPTEKIPQLVAVTYDDAVTAINYQYFENAIGQLKNPDGCKALATFFISHEYTDYTKVHDLYEQGHEIALHSISHTPLTTYWNSADVDQLVLEFGGQREMMAHFAQIKQDDIKGMRVPLFELSGNNTYLAMKQMGLTYDSSWPTQHFTQPGMWPYTLDYESTQDCHLDRCPTASIPGVWVNPILDWEDIEGHKCAMLDACRNLPEDDIDELFSWMMRNFERTYKGNRAPFAVYSHAAWFLKGENYFAAYKKFLEYLNGLPDVYFVTMSQIIDYVRAPTPDKPAKTCIERPQTKCKPRFCQLRRVDVREERWMKTCVACPTVYPWVSNPFGKPIRKKKN